ncbi:hypothetical protein TNCV_1681431 [Trichonephila clavipes]|nr:hypothetical protein TNCV_1681431 [Trichonephila clavipes]
MTVRTPAVSDPEYSDGTPPGTEVIPLAQHPVRELPLATRERRQFPLGNCESVQEENLPALNGPTGITLSDTNKTEVIAHSLEKQFHLNDIHNARKDEIITSVVDAYMDSNINNTDIIPPPHSPI